MSAFFQNVSTAFAIIAIVVITGVLIFLFHKVFHVVYIHPIRGIALELGVCFVIAFYIISGITGVFRGSNHDRASNYVIEEGVLVEYNGNSPTVSVPEGVSEIGENVFAANDTITSVSLPATLKVIGNAAFWHCANLSEIEFPNGLTYIGSDSFCETKMTRLSIPNSVTTIGANAFAYTPLEEVDLSENLEKLENHVFAGCNSLTNITIPDSINAIGDYTFSECNSLPAIVLPPHLISIGDGSFFYCSSLTSLTIPNQVMSIGAAAFEGCSSLTCIELPASIENIEREPGFQENRLFDGCISLSDIYYAGNETQWKALDIANDYSADIHINSIGSNSTPESSTSEYTTSSERNINFTFSGFIYGQDSCPDPENHRKDAQYYGYKSDKQGFYAFDDSYFSYQDGFFNNIGLFCEEHDNWSEADHAEFCDYNGSNPEEELADSDENRNGVSDYLEFILDYKGIHAIPVKDS